MAYKITDKPNAEGVSGTYPYGSIKDNTGGGNGVPVNRLVYTDMHQFFARITDLAGVVLNSLPDNSVNGWQFVTALQTLISVAVAAEASIRSAADTTLTNNLSAEAATRGANDTALSNSKVAKSGDSMTGNLAMGGAKVTGLAAASANGEAVRYEELQAEIAARIAADNAILTLVIDINDWNMDLSPNRVITSPIQYRKIKTIDVIIRNNGDSASGNLITYPGSTSLAGTISLDAGGGTNGTIILERVTGSGYDSTDFNSTSYNRGWVTIRYIP